MSYQATYHSAKVKDHPKPTDESTLFSFGGIGHHDGALGGPKDTGADAKQSTRKDDIAQVLGVVVAEVGGDVDRVADATERQGPADADGVGDGAGEESDNSEGRVESGIGIVASGRIELSTSTEAIDGIEHS